MLVVGAAAAVAARLCRGGCAARSMPDAAGVAGTGPGAQHDACCCR